MADLVHNRAKGRMAEWAERVNANDPTNSALVIMVLAASGIESDAVLRDKDSFADLVSGTTNEVTNSGYARKVLDQSAGITIVYDDTNDRTDVDFPDQTFTAVVAGDAWSDVETGYDNDTTAGTDSNILPGTLNDFAVTPDGSDIVVQTPNGVFRAQ